VRLSPFGMLANTGPILPTPDDDCDNMMINEYGEFSGMRIGSRNGSIQRKPDPVPLCPSQLPQKNLNWVLNRASEMGSQRLFTWVIIRPSLISRISDKCHNDDKGIGSQIVVLLLWCPPCTQEEVADIHPRWRRRSWNFVSQGLGGTWIHPSRQFGCTHPLSSDAGVLHRWIVTSPPVSVGSASRYTSLVGLSLCHFSEMINIT
jgi:hypothetical protein